MKKDLAHHAAATPKDSDTRSRWLWFLLAGCAVVILIGLSVRTHHDDAVYATASPPTAQSSDNGGDTVLARARRFGHRSGPAPTLTAEEVVAGKCRQFGRLRRELVHTVARNRGLAVPEAVERFFDAVERGAWEDIEKEFTAMSRRNREDEGSTRAPELDPFWSAVVDAYGVAEQVHDWPAQKLLDYGESVLGALRPGMVYVGGTDNGRWIPELLNETGAGEPHIIVTQNALADGRYLEFVTTLYGDRLNSLTSDDSKQAFQAYMTDAQKRLEHDQEFPEEPKQVRPGEDIRFVEGKIQVSGRMAVMSINEKLLQALMAKNPELGFALQESSPLHGTYADALPLGPLMELGARDGQNTFTAERAAESLNYWRNKAQQIISDPEATVAPDVLKAYSHDTAAAASLLAAHHFSKEAEEGYRLAAQLWPNAESVGGLANLLYRSGREHEAHQVLGDFSRKYPEQGKALEQAIAAARVVGPTQAGTGR